MKRFFSKIKPMPAVMTLLSAVYFFYVFSSEDTRLVADAVGGDPGGKVLPMVMAVFLFVGFLYITIRERPENKKSDPVTNILFLITLGLAVAYVLLIRKVGFILLSTILLFSLEYIFTTIDTGDKLPLRLEKGLVSGGATLALTAGLFFIMRKITKLLMAMGRNGKLPEVFTSTTLGGVISIIYVAIVVVLLVFICKKVKFLSSPAIKPGVNAGIVTIAVVLGLYVVFKQFFSVNLAPGILNF